jgi:alkyl hydroperoxide reductase subunit AhpC
VLRRGSLLLLTVLVVVGCGPGAPTEVALAELAFTAEDHDGEVVEIVGVVREFTVEEDDALEDHFVIEDDEQNRVQLVPHDAVEPYIDEHVRVVGEFTFDETAGRLIEVEEIEPEDRPADLAG